MTRKSKGPIIPSLKGHVRQHWVSQNMLKVHRQVLPSYVIGIIKNLLLFLLVLINSIAGLGFFYKIISL